MMRTELKNCLHCNQEFEAPIKEINRGNGKFCGQSCSSQHFGKQQKLHHTCKCGECGKIFTRDGRTRRASSDRIRFCSRECQSTFIGRNLSKKSSYIRLYNYVCQSCGKKYVAKHTKSRFCSRKCSNEHKQDTWIAGWLNGDVDKIIGGESLSERIRVFLMKRHNHKCIKCEWGEINITTGKVPLTVNHIDGDWSNNSPINLELICPNCHALTSNFGSLNKGKGRKQRLKRIRMKLETSTVVITNE